MKKRIAGILLSLTLLLCGCQTPTPTAQVPQTEIPQSTVSQSDDALMVHFLDVGQADSILLECGGEFVLVDGGNREDSQMVVSYLENQEVQTLKAVVGSHAHEDHIGGLPAVLAVYPTEAVYAPTRTYASKIFDSFVYYTDQQGLEITIPSPGDSFTVGQAKVTVLGPVKDYPDCNNTSIVLKVVYGNTSFLLTGDMEEQAEKDMLDSGADVKADVLKVGHHGSSTSSCYRFIREVDPQYAVISVGAGNSYGHPHKETMQLLQQAEITVLRTDELGGIVAVSDGNEITFTWEKQNAVPHNVESAVTQTFIGNKNSKKFHTGDCANLPKEENRVLFDSYSEAVAAGFSPCGSCNPK